MYEQPEVTYRYEAIVQFAGRRYRITLTPAPTNNRCIYVPAVYMRDPCPAAQCGGLRELLLVLLSRAQPDALGHAQVRTPSRCLSFSVAYSLCSSVSSNGVCVCVCVRLRAPVLRSAEFDDDQDGSVDRLEVSRACDPTIA